MEAKASRIAGNTTRRRMRTLRWEGPIYSIILANSQRLTGEKVSCKARAKNGANFTEVSECSGQDVARLVIVPTAWQDACSLGKMHELGRLAPLRLSFRNMSGGCHLAP